MKYSIVHSIVFFSIILVLGSCGNKDKGTTVPEGNPSDREAMLKNVADNIVIPANAKFEVKLDNMIAKSDVFRNNPTVTTLSEYRIAWAEAYIEWQKIGIFDFGPAADVALNSYMNVYPANVSNINANILSGNANLEVFESYSAQGFPAIDYLINGSADTDDDIVALYVTGEDADKRKAYLLRLTNQMHAKFEAVNAAWKGDYRNTFVSSTGTGLNASTSVMVNGIVFYYERFIRSGKFGIPSGAMTGTPLNASVEAYYKKDIGKILAQTAQQAFVDYFNGKGVLTGVEGPSLKTYLNALDAKDATTKQPLSEIINNQFTVVDSKLNVLSDNLSDEVLTNKAAMVAVYNEMQKAVRMLKVDMTSALSVTITYTDNDGD
jgi:predicted lipoprotein